MSLERTFIAGASAVEFTGAIPERRKGEAPRSGRDLRAGQRYNGVLWEPGRTVGLLGTKTGVGDTGEQHPGAWAADFPARASETAKSTQGLAAQRRTSGASRGHCGRLSGFIVLAESRRTELWEPGSREGSRLMENSGWDTGPGHRACASGSRNNRWWRQPPRFHWRNRMP